METILLIGHDDVHHGILIAKACSKKTMTILVVDNEMISSKPEPFIITPRLETIEIHSYSPKIEKRRRLAETQTYKPWYKRK